MNLVHASYWQHGLNVSGENCVNLILMDMSSGTRSSRSGSSSKMEDVISVTITAAEVESIVHKAVSQAVTDIKELFNSKLEALESRVQILEVCNISATSPDKPGALCFSSFSMLQQLHQS